MAEKRNRPTIRIVIKYLLLQLPGQVSFLVILLLLKRWMDVPPYIAWSLLGFWVGKDILMFPFMWRFYDPNQYPDRFRMDGRKGVSMTRLSPEGYVQVRGERWRAQIAEGQAPVEPGEEIRVEAVDNLKLTVSAWQDAQRSELKDD